jgi:hypothetical protein
LFTEGDNGGKVFTMKIWE